MTLHVVPIAAGTSWEWMSAWIEREHHNAPLNPLTIITEDSASERIYRWNLLHKGSVNVHVITLNRLLADVLWTVLDDPPSPTTILEEWMYADRCINEDSSFQFATTVERSSFATEAVRLLHEQRAGDDIDLGVSYRPMLDLIQAIEEALLLDGRKDQLQCVAQLTPENMNEHSDALRARIGVCCVTAMPTQPWGRALVDMVGDQVHASVLMPQTPVSHGYGGGSEEGNLQEAMAFHSEASNQSKRIHLISAGDTSAEIEAVLHTLLETHAALNSIGIGFVEHDSYQQILCDLLDARHIAWDSVQGIPLARHPWIMRLCALLRLVNDGFQWDDAMLWLQSMVSTTPTLDDIERLIWGHRGFGGFDPLLQAISSANTNEPTELTDDLLTIMTILSQHNAVISPNGVSAAIWLSSLLHLYDTLIVSRMTPREIAQTAGVVEILEQCLRALEHHATCSIAIVEEMLVARFAAVPQRLPYRGGVVIGTPADLRSLPLSVIGMCGVIEGAYPQRFRAVGSERDHLAEQRARTLFDTQQHQMISMLEQSAAVLVLSYPQFDGRGRQLHPAQWYQQWQHWNEHTIAEVDAAVRSHSNPVVSEYTVRDALSALNVDDLALTPEEHAIAVYMQEWKVGGHRNIARLLANPAEATARSRAMHRSRYSKRFTFVDGNLSGERSLMDQYWKELFDIAPISSTQLQEWATCPLRYFFHRVLHIQGDEPFGLDEEWSTTAADSGTLLHAILEQYFRTDKTRTQPLFEPVEIVQALATIIDGVWLGEARALIPSDAVRQYERDRLEWFALRHILGEVERRHQGYTPTYFEQEFGYSNTASWKEMTIAVPGALPLRVRGKIDRIDVKETAHGIGGIRVIDYKSGTPEAYADVEEHPLGGGRHIQAALYSAATKAHLVDSGRTTDDVDIAAQYWFVGEKGQGTIVGFPYTPALAEETASVLRTIAINIHRGIFPALPGDEEQQSWSHCRMCPYDIICPQQRDRMQEMKAEEPILSDLRMLQLIPETPHRDITEHAHRGETDD